MKVNTFINDLRETYNKVEKIQLTPRIGEYRCDGALISFQIVNFGKKNEKVINTLAKITNTPEINPLDLVPYVAVELDHQITSPELLNKVIFDEKVVIKEVIVEKIVVKEVPIEVIKEVPVEVIKETIKEIYVHRPFKIVIK